MVSLRSFTVADASALTDAYPQMAVTEIEDLIAAWNTKTYMNRFFEMYAVVNNHLIVGTISLYQHTSDCISAGPEIFPEYRNQGFAYQGMLLALQKAVEYGYKIAVAQVRKNNMPSIALHKKLGFEVDHDFVNSKGNDCCFFMKAIS